VQGVVCVTKGKLYLSFSEAQSCILVPNLLDALKDKNMQRRTHQVNYVLRNFPVKWKVKRSVSLIII